MKRKVKSNRQWIVLSLVFCFALLSIILLLATTNTTISRHLRTQVPGVNDWCDAPDYGCGRTPIVNANVSFTETYRGSEEPSLTDNFQPTIINVYRVLLTKAQAEPDRCSSRDKDGKEIGTGVCNVPVGVIGPPAGEDGAEGADQEISSTEPVYECEQSEFQDLTKDQCKPEPGRTAKGNRPTNDPLKIIDITENPPAQRPINATLFLTASQIKQYCTISFRMIPGTTPGTQVPDQSFVTGMTCKFQYKCNCTKKCVREDTGPSCELIDQPGTQKGAPECADPLWWRKQPKTESGVVGVGTDSSEELAKDKAIADLKNKLKQAIGERCKSYRNGPDTSTVTTECDTRCGFGCKDNGVLYSGESSQPPGTPIIKDGSIKCGSVRVLQPIRITYINPPANTIPDKYTVTVEACGCTGLCKLSRSCTAEGEPSTRDPFKDPIPK